MQNIKKVSENTVVGLSSSEATFDNMNSMVNVKISKDL